MNKRIISAAVSIAMTASLCAGLASPAYAEAKTPQYQARSRRMEKLNRGLVAVRTTKDTREQTVDGVYLSWRLFGTESLENQAFDIYKNGAVIHTTGVHDATNWIDTSGTENDKYKVVRAGEDASNEPEVTPTTNSNYAKPSEVGNGNSLKHSFTYMDIPIERPADEKSLGGDWSYYYNLDKSHEGGANDASVGDLDGDGDYEIVLKWDPTNAKDASSSGYSGRVYIDAYEIDPNLKAENNPNGHLYKWRIDLGQNIRAGAHDTQFFVYDFDGDGKSEVAMQTALGSKDGLGQFVTKAGDTDEIRNYTDEDNNTVHERKGHNIGPDFYTVFDGETGEALCTTAGIPLGREDGGDWGDSKMQRSHRFLGAVAYLDGRNPSIVMCRGYYNRAVVRAYTWDGSKMTLQWEHMGDTDTLDSLYGQGNHNLSVADVDNDGRDEIVYGSAVLDDDGKVIGNTRLNHGDAMHVSDFNNDGIQECFSVKEKSVGYRNNAADFRVAATGQNIWCKGASGDTGRGVMANIDDEYAKTNPDALALGWSSSHANIFDLKGNELNAKPSNAGSGTFDNSLVYWDGDLSRELLDANIIQKYDAANGWTKRFYGPSDGYTLVGGTTNNYTKRNTCLSADLWGDWREEIIMAAGKGKDETPTLRIFTSTVPTEYRLTTLMHDSQYRMAIAWQNVAYNQPPHPSYYIGSAALATDENGNTLNYLAPAVPYTKVVYEYMQVDATGITLDKSEVSVERTKTTRLIASAEPADAYPIEIEWKSSDESIATVEEGVVKGISDGEATITATVNGGPSVDCKVTVYSNHATGVTLSETAMTVGTGKTSRLTANVAPDETTDKSVTWSSDNERVAKVDKNGVVKGIGDGTATITATTVDGGFTASCVVNVYPLVTADVTDDTEFQTVNTDANTTITNTATSSVISQKNAESGAMVERVFRSYPNDKVKLSFRVVTGGQRLDGSNWNWSGHEYTLGLKFLDTQGNSILDILQAWTSGAQATQSAVMGGNKTNISGDWKQIVSDGENPLGRSTTRWEITFELDYRNDTCTATLAGADSNWTLGQTYQKSFTLNGAKFEKLQLYTQKDGSGTITATPDLTELKYERTIERGPRNSIKLTGIEGKKANLSIIYQDTYESVDLIGVLYDSDGKLVELQPKTVENTPVAGDVSEAVTDFIEFERDINDYNLKVFMWDSLSGVTPLCAHDEKTKE